jgi:hypothetical protein
MNADKANTNCVIRVYPGSSGAQNLFSAVIPKDRDAEVLKKAQELDNAEHGSEQDYLATDEHGCTQIMRPGFIRVYLCSSVAQNLFSSS